MSALHPLDLMNAVPEHGDIPRDLVALAKGCTCWGNSHTPGGCSMGEPIAVDVEAYRKLRDQNAELVECGVLHAIGRGGEFRWAFRNTRGGAFLF